MTRSTSTHATRHRGQRTEQARRRQPKRPGSRSVRQMTRAERQAEARRQKLEVSPRRGLRRPILLAVGTAAVLLGTVLGFVVASGSSSTPNTASSGIAGLQTFAEPDHAHTVGTVTYDRTPPAGGAHNPVWLNCGVYPSAVSNDAAVHSLEHGAVWITYSPSLSADEIGQLQGFVTSHYLGTQRYLVLSPYPGLRAPVVASAWGAQIDLTGPADARLARFVAKYEGGSQGGEAGGECTGGSGSPIA